MSTPDEFDEAMAVANGTPAYRPQPRPPEAVEDGLLPDWLTSRNAASRSGDGRSAPGRTGGGRTEAGTRGRSDDREPVDPWEEIDRAQPATREAEPERATPEASDAAAPTHAEPSVAPRRGRRPHDEPPPPPSADDPPAGHDRPRGPVRPPAVTWTEAGARAARAARPAQPRTVPLDDALNQVLAAPVVALTDLPAFDSSAMDGWAVAGPGPWRIVETAATSNNSGSNPGSVPASPPPADSATSGSDGPKAPTSGLLAGDSAATALPDGSAVRIATGARMPADATAVVRSERARVREDRLHLEENAPRGSAAHGADVRARGQECRSGDQLVAAGTPVTPAVLGLAAAAGYDELPVVPPPRAEVLVLGAELLWRGQPRGGMVRDALGPMVGPWLASMGAEVLVTRRLGDDAEALYEAVTTSTADLLVTTGGTAAGPVDHVRPMLDRLRARLLVDGVAVRPGHPMLLAALPGEPERPTGTRSDQYLIGLPGNPLAAVAGLVTLAGPLIRGFAGRSDGTYNVDARPSGSARSTLTVTQHGHPHDTQLLPVHRAGEGAEASPVRYTGPAMLRGVAAATHLAVIPPGGLPVGTPTQLLELP